MTYLIRKILENMIISPQSFKNYIGYLLDSVSTYCLVLLKFGVETCGCRLLGTATWSCLPFSLIVDDGVDRDISIEVGCIHFNILLVTYKSINNMTRSSHKVIVCLMLQLPLYGID